MRTRWIDKQNENFPSFVALIVRLSMRNIRRDFKIGSRARENELSRSFETKQKKKIGTKKRYENQNKVKKKNDKKKLKKYERNSKKDYF